MFRQKQNTAAFYFIIGNSGSKKWHCCFFYALLLDLMKHLATVSGIS